MKKFLAVALAALIATLGLSGCSGSSKSGSLEETGSVGGISSTGEMLPGEENPKTGISEAPGWTKTAVLYEVNIRQYTAEGTFKAFETHLDELWDMGVNTLWFMPIHPISATNRIGSLGSYYSVDDYRGINPEFGSEEDFRNLVNAAHQKGFHVMLDWVANHTGWDNAWIKEHPDWYTQENGEIIPPKGTGWNDVADLNYDNPEMRAEMISCMEYWVREFDIDGFRCDYAPGVPKDFWEEARTELDTIKDLYFIEEDLGWVNEGLLDYAFDTNYSSKVYETLVAISHDSKSADKLKLYLPKDKNNTFPMNYLDNHDVNSYDRTIAEAFGAEKLPEMYSLIFTLPGIPMIYSGAEIGNDKPLAFMDKDCIDWDGGIGDYRELIGYLSGLKKEHCALHAGAEGGDFELLDTGNKNIFAFARTADGERIVCVYNLSKRAQEDVDISGIFSGGGRILIKGSGGEYETAGDNEKSGEYEVDAGFPDGTYSFEPWEFFVVLY
ncbi:MAG: alpha-glucosidase C-terminal domain-containing protein [Lachnospiraceae bacterium]|nr:alpha-glucosidase C-terminal domain-containing protein [Lachnospiraceae bacterium]